MQATSIHKIDSSLAIEIKMEEVVFNIYASSNNFGRQNYDFAKSGRIRHEVIFAAI